MSHPGTVLALGVTAAASIGLAALAYRGYRRSGNPRLRFVVAAFALFAVKGLLATYSIQTDLLEHEDLELVLGLFDVTALSLFLVPFLRPRK